MTVANASAKGKLLRSELATMAARVVELEEYSSWGDAQIEELQASLSTAEGDLETAEGDLEKLSGLDLH